MMNREALRGKEPGVEVKLGILVPNKERIRVIQMKRLMVHRFCDSVAELLSKFL